MCGLVSVLSREAPIGPESIERALERLEHRGPDGQRVWLSDDRRVALGHRRLAIVDREGGAQPIANEDGSVVAIVNGEIYEDAALRRELETRHRFRSRSDSELLVHLYEEHGIERLLRELTGEIAFVLWDARRRVLYAARDRFGIKPLCYAVHGDRLLVASEAKALFALGVPARWDREAFAHAACLQYPPIDRTLFEGIRAIPPGSFLTDDGSGPRITPYWDLDTSTHRGIDAAGELRRRLTHAVDIRLRADVPIAVQLSGGIDSTSIAALATRRARLPCFTVRFDGGDYDEAAIAQRSAAALGLDLTTVHASDGAMADVMADAVHFAEGLAINVHLPAKLLLSRAIRESGARVVLSGEGADEALLGYAHLRADLGHAADDPTLRGLMMPSEGTVDLASIAKQLGHVPTFLIAKADLGARVRSLGSDALEGAIAEFDPIGRVLAPFDHARLAGRSPVERSAYVWMKLALGGYILRTLGDGTEMAASIEGRTPFLDPRVFEYAAALPLEQKIADGVEKHALREAMRGVVPEEVRLRRKHPFVGPPIGPAMETLLRDVVASVDHPFFDRAKIGARLSSLRDSDRKLWDPPLMLVLTSALLQQRFGLT